MTDDGPKVIATVGGPVDEASVALCLYAPDLEPEELTALLRCSPTSSHVRGYRKAPESPPAKTGTWILEAREASPTDFDSLVLSVLDQLPTDDALWQQLPSRFDIQLRFGLFQTAWNRGFGLESSTVARIARIGAAVSFDIYCECGDEEDG